MSRTPTTITAGRIDLVVQPHEVRINEAGLPAGHALKVVATTPEECLRIARAYQHAAAVLRNMGAK